MPPFHPYYSHWYYLPLKSSTPPALVARNKEHSSVPVATVFPTALQCEVENGIRCPNKKCKGLAGGILKECRYCQAHQCTIVTNGAQCERPKRTTAAFCQAHGRCQTNNVDGSKCMNPVKQDDPIKFKFCSDKHNCLNDGCAAQRVVRNSNTLGYCPEHLCSHPTCSGVRIPPSTFCRNHHCAAATCIAFIDVGDTSLSPADPLRFCERHRVCSAAACTRFCDIRDGGDMSRFCREHSCHTAGCDLAAPGGSEQYCKQHVCMDAQCGLPRANMASGHLCKAHECQYDGCHQYRYTGTSSFCAKHGCRILGCEDPVADVGSGVCKKHVKCTVVGCDRFHKAGGTLCETHEPRTCGFNRCTQQATNSGLCLNHKCSQSGCNQEVPIDKASVCIAHKCLVALCIGARKTMQPPQPMQGANQYPYDLMCPTGGTNAADIGVISGLFCSQHSCAQPDCLQYTESFGGRCKAHAQCAQATCSNVKDLTSGADGKHCAEHQEKKGDETASEGWAQWSGRW